MTTQVFNVRPAGNCLQLIPVTPVPPVTPVVPPRFVTASFNTPCDADDDDDFVLVPPPNDTGGGLVASCVFFPVTRTDQTPTRPALALSGCNSGGFTLQTVTVNTPDSSVPGTDLTGTYTALQIPTGARGCYQITITLTTTTQFGNASGAQYIFDLTLCSVVNNSLVPLSQFPVTTSNSDDVYTVFTSSVTGITCLTDGLLIIPCILIRESLTGNISVESEGIAVINTSMTLVRLGDC